MKKALIACGLLIALVLIAQVTCGASANAFEHDYRSLYRSAVAPSNRF